MVRRYFIPLLAVSVVVALTGTLSASAMTADPDKPGGPRDLKSMPWATQGDHDHNHDRPAQVDMSSVPRTAAAAATCTGGQASGYPCRNVDLLGNVPLSSMGGGSGSAGWGWTDPSNGKEYAIVGRSNGTSFVDISNPTSPRFLGNLPTATGTSSWRELAVHNNHAYIVSDGNGAHGMQVFNLTRLRGVTTPQTFAADARNTSFGRGTPSTSTTRPASRTSTAPTRAAAGRACSTSPTRPARASSAASAGTATRTTRRPWSTTVRMPRTAVARS